jgi:hypothetical protein
LHAGPMTGYDAAMSAMSKIETPEEIMARWKRVRTPASPMQWHRLGLMEKPPKRGVR